MTGKGQAMETTGEARPSQRIVVQPTRTQRWALTAVFVVNVINAMNATANLDDGQGELAVVFAWSHPVLAVVLAVVVVSIWRQRTVLTLEGIDRRGLTRRQHGWEAIREVVIVDEPRWFAASHVRVSHRFDRVALAHRSLDVDGGDAVAFAVAMAQRHGRPVRHHEGMATWKVWTVIVLTALAAGVLGALVASAGS